VGLQDADNKETHHKMKNKVVNFGLPCGVAVYTIVLLY